MGIYIAEQTETFHVPFGSPNSEGTPEASYVDVKAHPEWIPVLPSCVGWPETQGLLKIINSPTSPFMSLAADQGFTWAEAVEQQIVLTSFVTVCLAEVSLNTKEAMRDFAQELQHHMDHHLQHTTNKLGQRLHINIRLEIQPTRFHDHDWEGWSLMILMAASANEKRLARNNWSLGITALETAIKAYET
jgi:hypothetical protein